jgi:hypothetical protein
MDQLKASANCRLEHKILLDDGRLVTLSRWGVPFDQSSPSSFVCPESSQISSSSSRARELESERTNSPFEFAPFDIRYTFQSSRGNE